WLRVKHQPAAPTRIRIFARFHRLVTPVSPATAPGQKAGAGGKSRYRPLPRAPGPRKAPAPGSTCPGKQPPGRAPGLWNPPAPAYDPGQRSRNRDHRSDRTEAMTAAHPLPQPPEMHRRILAIALPAICANLTAVLPGLVDTAFIGHTAD